MFKIGSPKTCNIAVGGLAALALLLSLACGASSTGSTPAYVEPGGSLQVQRPDGFNWKGDIVFGDYRAHGIQAEKPVQSDWKFVGMRGLVMNQAVSFIFSGPQGDWRCRCALGNEAGGMDLNLSNPGADAFILQPTGRNALACILTPPAGGKTWLMSVYRLPSKWRDANRDPNAAGALSDQEAVTIRIHAKATTSVEEMGGSPPKVYKFLNDQGEIGQVRVLGDEQVWLPRGQMRGPLAAAMAGILLAHSAKAKK
ncbi:hypothetical protein [Desulfoferula mesophila]|uniref:Uncharacterized protein n=1 Tax=Desulfoferula mesophila TaxID=3058419 RepID=A0AAU9EDY4_9BACT|nr:hypothetical protein FAK_20960 [Desulfoferula mesophilus]